MAHFLEQNGVIELHSASLLSRLVVGAGLRGADLEGGGLFS